MRRREGGLSWRMKRRCTWKPLMFLSENGSHKKGLYHSGLISVIFGRTRREIKRRMRDFLNTFSESSLPSHHLSHNLTTTSSSAKRKREHEEELEEELASNGRLVYHDRFISLKNIRFHLYF